MRRAALEHSCSTLIEGHSVWDTDDFILIDGGVVCIGTEDVGVGDSITNLEAAHVTADLCNHATRLESQRCR